VIEQPRLDHCRSAGSVDTVDLGKPRKKIYRGRFRDLADLYHDPKRQDSPQKRLLAFHPGIGHDRLPLLGLTSLQFRTLLGFRQTTTIIGKLPFDAALPIRIMLPAVLLNLTWAVAPEIQFDLNNNHLAVPRI
jgi:hypothetical protein